MTERLLYPPELDPQAKRDRFDPEFEGSRYGLSRELSLAIWERVRADTADSYDRYNMDEARRRFHELAAQLAARGGRLQPGVGRTTRVRTEILGEPFDDRSARLLAPRVPGRQTLVEVEARRRAQLDRDSAAAADAASPATKPDLPGASDVMQSMAALMGGHHQSGRRRQQTVGCWRAASSISGCGRHRAGARSASWRRPSHRLRPRPSANDCSRRSAKTPATWNFARTMAASAPQKP